MWMLRGFMLSEYILFMLCICLGILRGEEAVRRLAEDEKFKPKKNYRKIPTDKKELKEYIKNI